jgi:hypothetical protein
VDPRLHEAEIPLPGGAVQRVRYFTDTTINKAVTDALGRLDPTRNGVILRGRVDNEGAAAVLAARVNDLWTIGLIADYKRVSKDWGVGFETKFEW